MPTTYKILLKNMHLRCIIGILDSERTAPQDIIAHVELTASTPSDILADDYQQVVCYDSLAAQLESLATELKPKLLETLAARCADLCLQDKRVLSAKIALEKPQALGGKAIPAVEYVCEKAS